MVTGKFFLSVPFVGLCGLRARRRCAVFHLHVGNSCGFWFLSACSLWISLRSSWQTCIYLRLPNVSCRLEEVGLGPNSCHPIISVPSSRNEGFHSCPPISSITFPFPSSVAESRRSEGVRDGRACILRSSARPRGKGRD